jgi:ketosteroid isomerase-like protein
MPPMFPYFLGLLLVGGCSRPTFDAAGEARKLLQRDVEWAQAASDGKDVDKIASYWSDEARVIEPGQPVYQGKTAIRAYLVESLKIPGFKIHWVSEPPVFSADGTMAYMPAATEITVPGNNRALTTLHSRSITIWRRESDGEWRCVIDIANDPPPPGATT